MHKDWNIDDRRWRELRYIEYIRRVNMNDLNFLHIESVERVRFAQDQPERFAAFAGRFADIGIGHLRLPQQRAQQLRLGLATDGVRVPGTRYVLRAARPWHALFEEQVGDFPTLPSDWMEGVRLVRCPGGGIEWLGRRHPMASYEGFNFAGFREMPSGWQGDDPVVAEMDDALRQELDRVLAEIGEYSEHILPELARLNPGMFPRERRVTRLDRGPFVMPLLIEWQAAAARLVAALTEETATLPRIWNVDQFGDFNCHEPGMPYVVENDRVRWLMHECYRQDWRSDLMPETLRPRNPDDKAAYLEAVKCWLLDPRTRSNEFERSIYWAVTSMADNDPDFVREIMDVRTWRQRIRANPTLTEAERQDELSQTYWLFNYALNNALLHVLASMSDNNFMKVRNCLHLPSFRGCYAGYLPEYLLQVLFTKVQVLTDLRLCCGRLIGPSALK